MSLDHRLLQDDFSTIYRWKCQLYDIETDYSIFNGIEIRNWA